MRMFWLVGLLLIAGCGTGVADLGVPTGFSATDLDGEWRYTIPDFGSSFCMLIEGGLVTNLSFACSGEPLPSPIHVVVTGDRVIITESEWLASCNNIRTFDVVRQADGTFIGTRSSEAICLEGTMAPLTNEVIMERMAF
ncbi:MAG TPA: hypothetical protein VNT79_02200 [Phycisphaerae bacterium]|nr:hypothetical protein [Phycisphaerae bacterium]